MVSSFNTCFILCVLDVAFKMKWKKRKIGSERQKGKPFPVKEGQKYRQPEMKTYRVEKSVSLGLNRNIRKRLPKIVVSQVQRKDIAFGKDSQVKLYYDVRTKEPIKAIIEVPKDTDAKTQRFVIAHEVGHLVAREFNEEEKYEYSKFGRSPSFTREDFANDFAIVVSGTTLGRYPKVPTKLAKWIKEKFLT